MYYIYVYTSIFDMRSKNHKLETICLEELPSGVHRKGLSEYRQVVVVICVFGAFTKLVDMSDSAVEIMNSVYEFMEYIRHICTCVLPFCMPTCIFTCIQVILDTLNGVLGNNGASSDQLWIETKEVCSVNCTQSSS